MWVRPRGCWMAGCHVPFAFHLASGRFLRPTNGKRMRVKGPILRRFRMAFSGVERLEGRWRQLEGEAQVVLGGWVPCFIYVPFSERSLWQCDWPCLGVRGAG